MAYNNGFPVGYGYYQPQLYGQQMNNQQMQQSQTQNANVQQSGFVPVPSEEVARRYPVAPGNSVSFKNENAPYVYVKTMGYSPLDMPIFEKFRLVKEEAEEAQTNTENTVADLSNYATKDELSQIKDELEQIKSRLNERRGQHAKLNADAKSNKE